VLTAITGADGKAVFRIPSRAKIARLELAPIPGHWSVGLDWNVTAASALKLQTAALPAEDGGVDWWKEKLGIVAAEAKAGAGVRVGVVDTGCGPHDALSHVHHLGTFAGGRKHLPETEDLAEHGTHVCGIIGARATRGRRYAGAAPASELFVVRVEELGAVIGQAEIANAIDALIEKGVHLINLSLGSPQASTVLNESIEDGWLHGAVCFASAGNNGGEVLWPGRHERVIAVSAIGSRAAVPAGSIGHLMLNGCSTADGMFGLVVPAFSARGPQVGCCAPGVGIISAVPDRTRRDGRDGGWGDLTGTSMACPVALGLAAVLLGRNRGLTEMVADERRSERIVELFVNHCVPLDLDADVQGNGLPVLDLAFIPS
jgi:subtilisin family serine protease